MRITEKNLVNTTVYTLRSYCELKQLLLGAPSPTEYVLASVYSTLGTTLQCVQNIKH